MSLNPSIIFPPELFLLITDDNQKSARLLERLHKMFLELGKKLERLPHNIPRGKMTEFKLAMKQYPECMKEDTVESYRLYYQTKQDKFNMVWTKRDIPEWFNA